MRIISTCCFLFISCFCLAQAVDTSKVVIIGNCWGKIKTIDTTLLSKNPVVIISCQEAQPVKKDTVKPAFRFHCLRTLTEDDAPLMVIDGVPQTIPLFTRLDPNTIDSISILKGVIAVAIYGSKGANGVILITTKKMKRIDPIIKTKNAPVFLEMEIYPNPVQKGAELNIQFHNDNSGEKTVRLINLDGKNLLQQTFKTSKGKNIFQISTDPRWSVGIYFVQLVYENGRVAASEKIIIQ